MSDPAKHIYEFGPFRVDALKRLLVRDGNQIRLPMKAFEILLVLLEEKGRLVDKNELMRRVWPDAVVEENNLTVNMSALRRSLKDSPGEHRYVVTVPGRGYQFVADVRQLKGGPAGESHDESQARQESTQFSSDMGSDGGAMSLRPHVRNAESRMASFVPAPANTAAIETHSTGEHIRRHVQQHKGIVLLVLTGLLATAIIVAYSAYLRSLARGAKSKAGISSIAVLPFTNVNKDINIEYLSDGLSESLINSLSQLPDVKIIARSSSFRYKGTQIDLKEVARALGVETILIGRVTQRGENLSISVELVNASDTTQIWGEQYDRKMSDLLAIQRDIASEIVGNLKFKVSGTEKGLAKHYTESNEAYQSYLKGRFYWNKRTGESLRKSIEYFNQAIERDPGFALAYAGLADSYVVPGNRMPPRDAMPRAKSAAMRALELDETLAEAHTSLGRVRAGYDWDWKSAEKEYKRAIELNPRYAVAHQWYGGYLDAMGRHNEGIAERKLAQDLDPLSLIINFELGVAFYYSRDYDKAVEQFQKALELDQNFPPASEFIPACYEQKGMYDEAIAGFKKAIAQERVGEWTMARAGLGHVYAVSGKKGEARKLLDELKQLSEKEYVSATSIALIYAGLGEKDQAFAWLNKAFEDHSFQLQWLEIEPRWDTLRSDPRFKNLERRVGFLQ